MRGKAPKSLVMGQAISSEGFFYLDFEEDELDAVENSNEANISFKGVAISVVALEVELRNIMECD
jgi:hypothetical protein